MQGRALHVFFIVVSLVFIIAFTGKALSQEVTFERLLNADKEADNWLMYYGRYNGWRYSPLQQINTTNAKRLVVQWAFQTGPDENFQVTPLVVDEVMYIATTKNHIFALDAATGKMRWRYNYDLPDKLPVRIWGSPLNRGVSIAKGKIVMGTADAHLIAVDAKTGALAWKAQVGNYQEGQSICAHAGRCRDLS